MTDANGNGIAGVTVSLYDSNRIAIAGTIADENGFYYFFGLDAGDYSVEFTSVDDQSQTVTVMNGELAQADFVVDVTWFVQI